MGEIDTKSIESVQTALCLFGEKADQKKYRSANCEGKQELEERELDVMSKDLANFKVQLEVKDSNLKQAVLKLELYQNTVDELSSKLKNSEAERDEYIDECREARSHIDELQSKIKDVSDKLLVAGKAQEQLLLALDQLKATEEDLHYTTSELTAAKEASFAATTHAELMDIAVSIEREKTEELLKHVSALNETIFHLKLAATEAENEKSTLLLDKEDKVQMATAAAILADEYMEEIRKQTETMQELENQLSTQTMFIDSLKSELEQVKEAHSSSLQAVTNAVEERNQLKSELDLSERVNTDLKFDVKSLETNVSQLKVELENANEVVSHLNSRVETLTSEIQKLKSEMDEIRRRESEAQVEIVLLKAELHRKRSVIAASEATEARTGLYLGVQQLALEGDDVKTERPRVNQEAEELQEPQAKESEVVAIETRAATDAQITISMQEYESLVLKAQKADKPSAPPPEVGSNLNASTNSETELNVLKEKLELSSAEVWELKCSVEQAVNRAAQAEKAKLAIEEQLRKWRESKQRTRTAFAALQEDSPPKANKSSRNPIYPPGPPMLLGKVLNIKF